MGVQALRIVPMTQWEVLQDGDVIPDGVVAEIASSVPASKKLVTIFKIKSLTDGWTDE